MSSAAAPIDVDPELPPYSEMDTQPEPAHASAASPSAAAAAAFAIPARLPQRPDPATQHVAIETVKNKPLVIGDTWFLVGRPWLQAWAYVCSQTVGKARPLRQGGNDDVADVDDEAGAAPALTEADLGPVDSAALAEAQGVAGDPTPNLKIPVQEGVDYELLPEEAWKLLASWYGVEGPSFPRKVIPGLVPGQERIEFYPPRFHISLLSPPFCTLASTATTTSMVTTQPILLSASSDVSELKRLVRGVFELRAQEDTDLRFWRTPAELVPLLAGRETVMQGLTWAEVELVDLGEETSLQQRTIAEVAELQTETPDIYLAVETRTTSHGFLLEAPGQMKTPTRGSAPPAPPAPPAPAPAPVPLFAQPSGDFFSNIQKRAVTAGSPAAATTATASASSTSSASSSSVIAPISSFQRQTRSQTAAERNAGRTKGITGLQNLGNTCFMNSALQCLSNTKELQEYFASGAYQGELNADNPLGQGGALASAFGALLAKLWDGAQSSIAPREFKMALSRFAPQFTGYQQQDTQELLAFLLDGLHEDLNRILKKPYIEAPEWEGGGTREMIELAQKQWDIYKLRNDSVIVDMFQGQYRSTLVCPVCNKVSIKFDPFMYLTLPLPNMKRWKGKGSFVPYDPSKPTVNFEITLPASSTIGQMRAKLASWFNLDPKRIICGEIFNSTIYKWWHDYDPVSELLSNDRLYFWEVPFDFVPPKREGAPSFSLAYGKTAMHPEQLESSVKEPPPAPGQPAVLVVFSEVEPHAGGSSAGTSSYRRPRSEKFGIPFIVAIPPEQLDDEDALYDALIRQYVRFTERPQDMEAIFKIDGTGEQLEKEDAEAEKLQQQQAQAPTPAADGSTVEESADAAADGTAQPSVASVSVDAGADAGADGRSTVNGDSVAAAQTQADPDAAGDADVQLVSEEPIHEQHDADVIQEQTLRRTGKRLLFRLRLTGRLPTEDFPKGADDWDSCSEDLGQRAARLRQAAAATAAAAVAAPTADAADRMQESQEPAASSSTTTTTTTTTSKAVDGKSRSSAQWPLLYTGAGLVCLWAPAAKEHFFDRAGSGMSDWGPSEMFEDPDIQTLRAAAANRRKTELTIDNCLDEFTKEEQLGEDDPWYCPRCKEFRQATKKFDLWEVPDILVVHLKRFSGGRSARDKLEDLVNFPLEGLDLSDRVESRRARAEAAGTGAGAAGSEDEEERPIYDLYAVDNHYGGLGGGHYTAYARNSFDEKWYYFDDSSVRSVEASAVQTSAAYVLFYRRRTSRPIGGKSQEKIRAALAPATDAAQVHDSQATLLGEPGSAEQQGPEAVTEAVSLDDGSGIDGAEYVPMEMQSDWALGDAAESAWNRPTPPSPVSDRFDDFQRSGLTGRRWSPTSSQGEAEFGSSRAMSLTSQRSSSSATCEEPQEAGAAASAKAKTEAEADAEVVEVPDTEKSAMEGP